MIEDLIRQVNSLQRQIDALIKPEIPLGAGIRSLFSAFVSGVLSNVTGDGTVYTPIFDNEIFDTGGEYNPATGVFTASRACKILFIGNVLCQDIGVAHNGGWIYLVTSNRTYPSDYINPGAAAYAGYRHFKIVAIADMSAGHTAYINIFITGGTKIVDVFGNNAYSFFQGYFLP